MSVELIPPRARTRVRRPLRFTFAAALALAAGGCAHTTNEGPPPAEATAPVTAPGVTVAPGDLEPGDHSMDTAAGPLWFHVAGEGPPCIAHPGGPGVEWTYLRMPEVEQTLRMIYLEPVGTGQSGRLPDPNDYSYARYAQDVDALRAHLGLERVCLLGHSHGSMVALTYAVSHSDRLTALILYGATAALDEAWNADANANAQNWFGDKPWFEAARAGWHDFWSARTDEAVNDAFQRWVPLFFADWDGLDPALQERVRALHVWAGPSVARGPRFDVTGQLGQIHAPTLVITGERDYAMSPVSAERIHQGIAGSQVVVLPHAGHMGHLEQPDAFAAAVARFISGTEGLTPAP